MAWIKRNLFMLIGGLVALALLGVAGWFLWSKYEEDVAVTAEVTAATEALKALVEADPHPGTEKLNNIEAARKEVKRLTDLKGEIQKFFGVLPTSTNHVKLDPAQFKNLLENSIDELERESKKMSVKLPDQYAFGFSEQRKKVQFAQGSLDILANQVTDVKTIAQILFAAHINQLISFRRSTTADDPVMGGADYLTRKMSTNKVDNTVTIGYEVKFVGFSADLAAVLEGFIKAPGCFIVKSVGVDRVANSGEGDGTIAMAPTINGMSAAMAQRYGLMGPRGGRYGGMRPPPTVAAPIPGAPVAAPPKPGTYLDENKVEFVLNIDTVRLLDTAKK